MLNAEDLLQMRYRIVRPLGRGGMGAVYEAIDERFGEPIALKEILLETGETPVPGQFEALTAAFEREAKSLAKARHEAVPFVRDFFSEGNGQYLVMELVEGDDLAKQLTRRGRPFRVERCLDWMDQLLDALDYLHNLSPPIIHRDIKPQNLKPNARGKLKLLDFGIAKSLDSATFTITNQTFVGATLNYSPIEQLIRVMNPTFREYILLKHKDRAERILSQTTDCRSDIYALGATFYHLLTGRPPSDVVKRTLDVWEKRSDPLPSPSTLNPEVPEQIDACLLKALSIERDDRFGSAAEMRTSIFGESTNNAAQRAAQIPQPPQDILEIEVKDPAKAKSGKTTEVLLKWNNQPGSVQPSLAEQGPPSSRITAGSAESVNESGSYGSALSEQRHNSTDGAIPYFGLPAETKGSYDVEPNGGPAYAETGSNYAVDSMTPDAQAMRRPRRRTYLFWAIPFGVLGIFAIAVISVIAYISWSPRSAAFATPDLPASNAVEVEPSPPPAFERVTTELSSPTPLDADPTPTETPLVTSETSNSNVNTTDTEPTVPSEPTVRPGPKGSDRNRQGPRRPASPPRPKPADKGAGCMFNNTCR